MVAVLALSRNVNHLTKPELACLAVSALAYALLSAASLYAYYIRGNWGVGPKLRDVWDLQFTEPDDRALKWNVTRRLWQDADANLGRHNTKLRAVKIGLGCLVVQTVTLVALLVLVAHR